MEMALAWHSVFAFWLDMTRKAEEQTEVASPPLSVVMVLMTFKSQTLTPSSSYFMHTSTLPNETCQHHQKPPAGGWWLQVKRQQERTGMDKAGESINNFYCTVGPQKRRSSNKWFIWCRVVRLQLSSVEGWSFIMCKDSVKVNVGVGMRRDLVKKKPCYICVKSVWDLCRLRLAGWTITTFSPELKETHSV